MCVSILCFLAIFMSIHRSSSFFLAIVLYSTVCDYITIYPFLYWWTLWFLKNFSLLQALVWWHPCMCVCDSVFRAYGQKINCWTIKCIFSALLDIVKLFSKVVVSINAISSSNLKTSPCPCLLCTSVPNGFCRLGASTLMGSD